METWTTTAVERGRQWFLTPGSAINLAVIRIMVCVFLFGAGASAVMRPRRLPDIDPVAPDLLGFLLVELPRHPSVMRGVAVGMTFCAALGAIGYKSRWAMAGLTIFVAYHYGVPQIFGKVDHNHHLLWISAVLAMSPSGDALSIERWQEPPGRSVRYGFPLRVIWVLLGLTYFFPGLWKLLSAGPTWASARNMSGIMWSEWIARGGYDPTIDISDDRLLLILGGALTLVIELGFLLLVVFRRTRWLAVVGGIGFHLGVGLTIGIWFIDLPLFYVALVDWTPWLDRLGAQRALPPSSTRGDGVHVNRSVTITCAILIGAVVLAGAGRTLDGWPVASYPDFGYQVRYVYRYDLRAGDKPAGDVALAGLSRLQEHRLLASVTKDDDALQSLADDLLATGACDEVDAESIDVVRQRYQIVVGDPSVDGELERRTVLDCSG